MSVNYNNFAKTFSNSRKNMKWEEIEYFLSFVLGKKDLNILDIGCGNGRLLGEFKKINLDINRYLGIDSSIGLLVEAINFYPEDKFQELNMLKIEQITQKFSDIFFIASFHHLETIEERIEVLKKSYNILEDNGKIFMTNWALNSDLNNNKYKQDIISGSKNNFGGLDYKIKIGEFERFYHCYTIEELNYLFSKAGFKVIDNYLFENGRNYVSIISK